MRRGRVTREWNRSTAKRTSRVRGVRRGSVWPRIFGFSALLLVAFFVGRGFNKEEVLTNADEVNNPKLDVGGSTGSDTTVSDILSGHVLSIPVDDAIVLDETVINEANIAQDTTDISVAANAVEINLAAIGSFHGTAAASSQFADGAFQHVIVATLPDLPVGYYYEGWLIRSKPFNFVSTGKFIQHADDLKWYLLFESPEDRLDYKKVVITLEPDDGNIAPADHVMEGVFE
ncbi:hypothetical protein COV06_02475 [Candidatus Uhrbacteria bacterium CG10_big_fil_rev_8_21_14_0_10_50_16]|uniref:Uncharacterized protein n=1 Tax=Candidatus Uhrbacteria bacterium CG10_big_fil_rev_8_21_14_0_10_50_16 TaxID=1975039 RepID=A0A2H0RMI6_9BACT|nr:MAG: hypothetical protein COV06_02475 [Candidatus Uhrbacteria bacterium CG10_big_fil_rev_8_21_14_0_10_50_16]